MINLEQAIQTAEKYIGTLENMDGVGDIYDAGDSYILFGKMIDKDCILYGQISSVKVDKENGRMESFPLSDMHNFDILEGAKKMS